MSKLRVTIEIDEMGKCTALMEFRQHDIEADGNSPSEALQNLAETLGFYEDEPDPI